MPRKATPTREELTDRALRRFWVHGFHGSSMDNLVETTGANRQRIYQLFGGKKALFLACFDRYQRTVVTPAFQRVEAENSNLRDIAAYFEYQIRRGEAEGLPGSGCFVANSATEVGPNDAETRSKILQHNQRLKVGFGAALGRAALETGSCSETRIAEVAELLVIFSHGLWSRSRMVADARTLRRSVEHMLLAARETLR